VDQELAEIIGQGARCARRKKKLTQEQVAERIDVSSEFYARLERGHALPSVPTLRRICNVLDVSADVLLFGDCIDATLRVDATTADPPELRILIEKLAVMPRGIHRFFKLLLVELGSQR